MDGNVFLVVIMLFCSLLAFLVARHFLCWYWKINRIVELLENLVRLQGGVADAPVVRPVPEPAPPAQA